MVVDDSDDDAATPTTPGPRVSDDNVISLLHSGGEGAVLARRAESARAAEAADVVCAGHIVKSGRSRRSRPVVSLLGDDDGVEDLLALQAAAASAAASPAKPTAAVGAPADGEVVAVAATGLVPNRDYAHIRTECQALPPGSDWLAICPKCYCFVCDIPAGECTQWDLHAFATPGVECWDKLRNVERKCRKGKKPRAAKKWEREACAIRERVKAAGVGSGTGAAAAVVE